MNIIKGRHWVFIIGIICATLATQWDVAVAFKILELLLLMGIGIALTGRN